MTEYNYVSLNEHGQLGSYNGSPLSPEQCETCIKQMTAQSSGVITSKIQNDDVIVEPFDQALVAKNIVDMNETSLTFHSQYQVTFTGALNQLMVDEWDRFLGVTDSGLVFIMSEQAQDQFFNLVDNSDESSFVFKNKKYQFQKWPRGHSQSETPEFWNKIYQADAQPGWDLGGPHGALPSLQAQLKLSRRRILVLGAGRGHDANWWAQQGHKVTAVDYSPTAIEQGRALYPESSNLRWVCADATAMPKNMLGQFDLVFEHTCYPAIPPEKRSMLVKSWVQCLAEGGQLLGLFLCFEKVGGPPFSASEWEIRERLKKNFKNLYWMRWRKSIPHRVGRELIVFSEKITRFS